MLLRLLALTAGPEDRDDEPEVPLNDTDDGGFVRSIGIPLLREAAGNVNFVVAPQQGWDLSSG